MQRARVSLLTMVLLLSLAPACGSSGDAVAPPKTSQGRGAAASPEEAVRAYVDAINAGNGARVCGLLLESAAYEFRVPDWAECPKFVSAYIGYAEDDPSESFVRAEVVAVERGQADGDLREMKVKLSVQREEGPPSEPLEDVLWLVQRDGVWRLAKASLLLYAAFGAYQIPEGILEAPDLDRQERDYQEALTADRTAEEAEQASFKQIETGVLRCGGVESAYDDAPNDLHIEGSRELTKAESVEYATADVRRVEVDVDGDDICARFTLADDKIEDQLLIRFDIYSPERSDSSYAPSMELYLQVQADGRARLAYEDIHAEEDEWGRNPVVAVPGYVAREGPTFSLRANRNDLLRVMRDRELPSWDGFLWGGIMFYHAMIEGNRRAISDDVHGYLALISHPGGRVFNPDDRLQHDLPTD